MTLTPPKDFIEQAENFIENYGIVEAFFTAESNKHALKPHKERTCLFCGRSYPDTTFREDAHLIPELLGNKTLFSDFECDECNHDFGVYDNDLANYLGISRTLARVRGKKNIPGFTAPGKAIQVRTKNILEDESLVISRTNPENGTITVDRETGKIIIKCRKNPFAPLNVYKSILKVALSLISGEETKRDYASAIAFLMNKNHRQLSGCFISGFILPMSVRFPPHAFLFKKKDPTARRHTHVLALYVQNLIFALPVPLNQNDQFFFDDSKEIVLNLYPPLFTEYTNGDALTIHPFNADFSSEEKETELEDEIICQLDPEQLSKAATYNGNKRQILETDFDPAAIVQIIMRENHSAVDPAELYKALHEG